jgi:hypothetical protein
VEALGFRSEGFSTWVLPQARAAGNIHRGTMAGKLKGVMPATTPSGWRIEKLSTPVPTCSVNFVLEKSWDACGKSDDLKAEGGFASGVGEDLAMFPIDDGNFVEAAFEDISGEEKNAGAVQGWLRRPVVKGCGDCGADFGFSGEGGARLDLTAGGVIAVSEPARYVGGWDTRDPVLNFPDGRGGVQWGSRRH